LKISKDNLIIRYVRWLTFRTGFNRFMPTILRFGGWLFILPYRLVDLNVLLLTTTGRKTGKLRTTSVMFVEQDNDFIIAAHHVGHDRHPYWYLNILANPNVTVEAYWKRRVLHAQPVKDQTEYNKLMELFPFGNVTAFQEHTTRKIPIIRLNPTRVGD